MSNNKNARYKESRELKDRETQKQTQGYVSRFEPLLYVPAFVQKDFHYVHQGPPQRDLHRGITTIQIRSTQL